MQLLKVFEDGRELWLTEDFEGNKVFCRYNSKMWSGSCYGDLEYTEVWEIKRTEALAKMPKTVEFETLVKGSYFYESGFSRLNFPVINKLHCGDQMLEFESNGKMFEEGQRVKVTITKVVE